MEEHPIWIEIAVPFGVVFAIAVLAIGWVLRSLDYRFVIVALLGEAAALALSWVVGARISSHIRRLGTTVKNMTQGSTTSSVPEEGPEELRSLARLIEKAFLEANHKVKEMDERQKRFESILSHLSEGIVIVAKDGKVTMYNPAAASILGIEHNRNDLTLASLTGQHRMIDLWRKCRGGEIRSDASVQLKRNGRFIKATATPLPDMPGFCLITIQDITEMRLVDEMRKDFVSNISHELRTPLASMKILADTLRESGPGEQEVALRFLDKMDQEIDALVQMADELLELSRIESGQVPLKIEEISLDEVVFRPVERLSAQIRRAGLELRIDLPTPSPKVLADPERLPRVVTNLVHNAIKFTEPEGRITIFAKDQGDEIVVGVSDTGIGIPKEALPRIFERFYKSDKSRRSQGTGLGLSISKHLVQAHGGRIWVESREGRGSTFYFTINKAPEGQDA